MDRDRYPTARQQLQSLIRREGFLYADEQQRITNRLGRPGQWMLYLWPITLTGHGSAALADEMLRLVEPFESTQLAAHGFGAVPLMTAMVMAGGGRYTGLVVRPERKRHGAMRRIDGAADRSKPVIVVDDSLSSGTSFQAACRALEDEGYEVEGTACLVDFPSRGGRERAEALGYRVATAFDVWDDLRMRGPAPAPAYRHEIPERWAADAVPDGLHPAVAARRVVEHFVATGDVLRPPVAFDRTEDGRGGTFVSLRRRLDDHRLGRRGFWHFDPADADPQRDLVLASVQTVRSLPEPLAEADVAGLKMGVTFFGPLELVAPTELDFSRYGIVVRSRVQPRRRGGALPNTQYFTSTQEQYRHARWTNARLFDVEEHDVFRHELVKRVEPGEEWPPYGTAVLPGDDWSDRPDLGDRLFDRLEQVLGTTGRPTTETVPLDDLAHPVSGVAVTRYGLGGPRCFVAPGPDVDAAFLAAGRAVTEWREGGSAGIDADADDATAVTTFAVTVLHSPERLDGPPAAVARKLRRGKDALAVQQGTASAIFLESAVVHHDCTKEELALALMAEAGTVEGPVNWTTYKAATWVRGAGGVVPVDGGGCRRAPGSAVGPDDLPLIVGHLLGRLDDHGWPAYGLRALDGTYVREGTAARCLHALRVLDDAGRLTGTTAWRTAARDGVDYALGHLGPDAERPALQVPGHGGGTIAESYLLGCLAGMPDLVGTPTAAALAAKLWSCIGDDGCVLPPGVSKSRADNDLFPGVVLFNLALYGLAIDDDLAIDWKTVCEWYRRRAGLVHPWRLMAWHAQVWGLVGDLTGDLGYHQVAVDLADWMAARQLRVDGSFFTGMGTGGPGFDTAFSAEGVAAGWRSAVLLGDDDRAARLADCWRSAMAFTDRLVFRPEDTYWTARPERVLGGVRASLTGSSLQVDYTGHAVQALLGGVRALEAERLGGDR